jgi:hypothetical protein
MLGGGEVVALVRVFGGVFNLGERSEQGVHICVRLHRRSGRIWG